MCILFVYRNPKAGKNSYKLIIAANRDEMYKRPAREAHYWENHPDCLGGTDNEPGREGGTWLALSKTVGAAIILNLNGETKSNAEGGKGRGHIVTNFVTSNKSTESYLRELHEVNENGHPYNPYNLVLVDMHDTSVRYLTSSTNSAGPLLCEGYILGFGNSPMEQPYAKVRGGKEQFEKIVKRGSEVGDRERLVEELRRLLKSKERYLPDPELQRRSPEWYESLSSIFVEENGVGYGTRTHSIILVDGGNRLTFVEDTRMLDGTWTTQTFDTSLKVVNLEEGTSIKNQEYFFNR